MRLGPDERILAKIEDRTPKPTLKPQTKPEPQTAQQSKNRH